ncbi:MAG TPA: hypothetical protein VNA20_18235 [Frankiaceae bacterium]|nr:hypothetical protein [Frankiaceae bacterium]
MTRTRPLFLVALVLALAGLGAYLYVPAALGRAHRAAQAEADRIARAVPELPGAKVMPRDQCNGDVFRRCTHLPARDVVSLVPEVEATLARVSGRETSTRCDEDTDPEGLRLRFCTVRIGTGRGHGVIVMVDTATRRDKMTKQRVLDGTWVSVTAG